MKHTRLPKYTPLTFKHSATAARRLLSRSRINPVQVSVASESFLRISVYCESLSDGGSKKMEITGLEIKSLTTLVQKIRSLATKQVTRSIGSEGSNNLYHRRRREASCHPPTDIFFSYIWIKSLSLGWVKCLIVNNENLEE